jgi:DNA-binding SARP family transcriptional activator
LADQLEILAHGITAILATWLGLLVLTRASRSAGAPIFSLLCLLLVTWSMAIIVQRLGDPALRQPLNLVEDAAAFLLPPVTAHLAISVAFERRRSGLATAVLVVGYGVAILAIVQAAVDPAHEIGFSSTSFAPLGLPPAVIAWAFAAVRLGVWLAGIAFLAAGLREFGIDRVRRTQLQFAIATIALGVIGAMARIVPPEIGGPRWVGVSLVAIAMMMATYAVVAQQLFLSADVAGRAVRWSVFGGLAVAGYVAVLVVLDRAAASALGIDLPIVTALAIVVTLALFEPISTWLQGRLATTSAEADRARLLQALGGDALVAQRPEESVGPALARMVRTFELTGAEVVDQSGNVRAATGVVDREDPRAIRVALVGADGGPRGVAMFGRKRTDLAFSPADHEAIALAADYLGSSLRLAERQDEQVTAIADLRAEQTLVESRGTALLDALDEASEPSVGLEVHALGSLRANRDGEPVRRWGGEKAGSRQAEGIFAFLLDRGERGASKDEIVELVWPDVDLDRADVAFHRTMLGLRSVLQPGRRGRGESAAITFHNDRYRLDPTVVGWSDVTEYERLIGDAGRAAGAEGLRMLEEARSLYRGDYLDDCPYYGDSADVEDRRGALRSRQVDLLVELGHRYAARGDRPAAAACYREAQAVADDELPEVADALAGLGGAPRSAEAG